MTVSMLTAFPCLHEITLPELSCVQSGLAISTDISHVRGLSPSPVLQVLTATIPTGWRSVPY